MTQALQGVNLGGWLVAEKWMTPQLFNGVNGKGEAALIAELGATLAARRLEAHRSSFITEADFAWLAERGIDFVRLPVGYWLFEPTREYIEGEQYVRLAFAWAYRHGVKIILDFHGLQGSQNGKDHSGKYGGTRFYWGLNRRRALRTLAYIARTYGAEPTLLGIEVINEPRWPLLSRQLIAYYKKAYKVVAANTDPQVKVIVSDGYRPRQMAKLLRRAAIGPRIVLDVHLYQIYSSSDRKKSLKDLVNVTQQDWARLITDIAGDIPVLVGEWSAAVSTSRLNNDGTQRYFSVQQHTFNKTAWGHAYWSYKVPGKGAWDYRSIAEKRRAHY